VPVPVNRERLSVLWCYVAFILVGVNAGVSGVLLPPQIRDYGVDKATIGITFFTGSAGFVLAGIAAGALIHRFGARLTLALGGGVYVLAAFYTATRPSFEAFVVLQLAVGFGTGLLECVLNVYLSPFPDATRLLNRLHAFFGVGALLGPLLATFLLGFASWPTVWLVLGLLGVPVVIGFLVLYPRFVAPSPPAQVDQVESVAPGSPARGLLTAAMRNRGVLLATVLLTVYVGLEIGLGNWGFSYLVEGRGQSDLLAGYTISGYWLGLTIGRFLISPLAARVGLAAVDMIFVCLAGVTIAATVTWVLPNAAVASVGFVLIGFFLGPIFPTTIAMVPSTTPPRLVPTAIGVMNGGSVVGGSGLPWLAGAIAQRAGVWTLLPFSAVLALLQVIIWWRMAVRIRRAPILSSDSVEPAV
jgi:fucose permease